MTITKQGMTEAKPEATDNTIVRHPNWPFRKVPLGDPFPPGRRFIHDTTSKVPPVIRTVVTEEDMKQPDPLKQI
jgi:hypothetical protein